MSITQTEYTFKDLENLPGDGKLFELVRGQLVEKEMGQLSVWIVSEILFRIRLYLDKDPRGWVFAELPVDCFPWIPNHGRRPDVAYFHRDRLPQLKEEQTTVAPNWVIEVVSKNDNALDVEEKVEEYLRAGVELVWLVYPTLQSVRSHTANDVHIAHSGDVITGGPVLPKFSATVRNFFPKASEATSSEVSSRPE